MTYTDDPARDYDRYLFYTQISADHEDYDGELPQPPPPTGPRVADDDAPSITDADCPF